MRLLLVGDPHVTVEELDDAQALMDYVCQTAAATLPDGIVLLGDLHHNHALVRVEVTDFWLRNLARLSAICPTYAIVGNHDRPNDQSSSAHALQPYKNICTVVDRPLRLDGSVVLLPFYHDNQVMVEEVAKLGLKDDGVLVCHQTFDGSMYDNGFYAPDGVDPVLIGVPLVISGHIHTAQRLDWASGQVYYVGSPRWRTLSDANVPKNIALWNTVTRAFSPFNTAKVCSPISKATVSCLADLDKVPFGGVPNARFHIDIVGTEASVEELTKEVKTRWPKAKVRAILSDRSNRANRVTESEGVGQALRRFVEGYKPPFGTPIDVLRNMVAQRLQI